MVRSAFVQDPQTPIHPRHDTAVNKSPGQRSGSPVRGKSVWEMEDMEGMMKLFHRHFVSLPDLQGHDRQAVAIYYVATLIVTVLRSLDASACHMQAQHLDLDCLKSGILAVCR